MKRLLLGVLCVAIFMTGCAKNYYNIPTDSFADKVKVLGIAPFFVDADSDIKHPQKDSIIQLVNDLNRKYEPQLARKLKASGSFYAVSLLDNEPNHLFASLLFRREKRDDAEISYNKYFWNNDELRGYIQKNNLDAVMLITVSGLTKSDKIFSSNLLTSLESDYNYLTLTAQILDANGTILWEYPNFRRRILSYSPLINLQYPDFSESDANLSRKTEVKFKTLDGIRRTLEHKQKDWLFRETPESEAYGAQFEEIVSLTKYDRSKSPKSAPITSELDKQLPIDSAKASELRREPAQTTIQHQTSPVPQQKAAEPLKVPAAPIATGDEIVPATDSTR